MHIRPLYTHDKEIKINQNNKEDHELIMGKQGQEFEASNEYRRPAATQDQRHQQPLTNSIDQATLAGLPRRTLSPFDDVKDIIGISTLEPSHHGPKVLRMIIGSMWKSEAKVTQSTWSVSSNMQQLLTTDQASLASPSRHHLNPYADVEGRVGIFAQGSSHHGPRALLKVNGKALKSEHKVA